MVTEAYSNDTIIIDRNVILADGSEVEAVVSLRKLEENSWNLIDISTNEIIVTEGLYKYYYTYGNQTKELLLTVKNYLQIEQLNILTINEEYQEDSNITEEEFNEYKNNSLNSTITQENQKELKEHGNYAFPVNISIEKIESYEKGTFLWHWHPEIELTLILSGQIEYQIEDSMYLLSAGDGIFCNSNSLHSGHMHKGQDCTYLSITFHPRFLYGYENSILNTKYVNFITANELWASLILEKRIFWQAEVLDCMKKIYEMSVSEKQTVEISKELDRGADILVLDEPCAGLDPAGKTELWALLHHLHKTTVETIIVVSHDMNDVAKHCTRDGTLKRVATPSELFDDTILIEESGLEVPVTAFIKNELLKNGLEIKTDYTDDNFVEQIVNLYKSRQV